MRAKINKIVLQSVRWIWNWNCVIGSPRGLVVNMRKRFLRLFQDLESEKCDTNVSFDKETIRELLSQKQRKLKFYQIQFRPLNGFKDNAAFSYDERRDIGLPFDSMAMPWSVLRFQSYSRKSLFLTSVLCYFLSGQERNTLQKVIRVNIRKLLLSSRI